MNTGVARWFRIGNHTLSSGTLVPEQAVCRQGADVGHSSPGIGVAGLAGPLLWFWVPSSIGLLGSWPFSQPGPPALHQFCKPLCTSVQPVSSPLLSSLKIIRVGFYFLQTRTFIGSTIFKACVEINVNVLHWIINAADGNLPFSNVSFEAISCCETVAVTCFVGLHNEILPKCIISNQPVRVYVLTWFCSSPSLLLFWR